MYHARIQASLCEIVGVMMWDLPVLFLGSREIFAVVVWFALVSASSIFISPFSLDLTCRTIRETTNTVMTNPISILHIFVIILIQGCTFIIFQSNDYFDYYNHFYTQGLLEIKICDHFSSEVNCSTIRKF